MPTQAQIVSFSGNLVVDYCRVRLKLRADKTLISAQPLEGSLPNFNLMLPTYYTHLQSIHMHMHKSTKHEHAHFEHV